MRRKEGWRGREKPTLFWELRHINAAINLQSSFNITSQIIMRGFPLCEVENISEWLRVLNPPLEVFNSLFLRRVRLVHLTLFRLDFYQKKKTPIISWSPCCF